MPRDWERCNVLAAQLVDAARDFDREPGTIAVSDMLDAFTSVANRLLDIGAQTSAVCNALRGCANSVEWATEARRPRLVLASNQDHPATPA